MAKKSKIVKNNKREETANFYSSKRKELLAVIRDPESTYCLLYTSPSPRD